jgi:hypothetical protein
MSHPTVAQGFGEVGKLVDEKKIKALLQPSE